MTPFKEYIAELNRQFKTGMAREHGYRPALQQLLAKLLPDMVVTNEPARFECGVPDYIIARKSDNLPKAFVEAKDIDDPDLDGKKKNKAQFDRYKTSLDRIVFTDYLDFHFYENGEWLENIRVGETKGNAIHPLPENYERLAVRLSAFAESKPQKITSAGKLAGIMAAKAQLLAGIIRNVLDAQRIDYESEQLQGQYEAFKAVLIHDLSHEDFADIYAQTITYGMFAARVHDTTPEDFSRQEAASLIPKTNPFLRKIFQDIAGYDLDEHIAWIVDDLANAFSVADMGRIMASYGANDRHSDPMIHFYEDFLSAYNPKSRKQKGVWYTPSPVVRFMVKSVDEILQRDFGLPMGLADCSINKTGKRNNEKKFHRVQILDPAVGTGAFLAETINCIYDRFANQHGMWQSYVEEHLLPRLNGFELLMAPYAIAHLKLDWLLNATGYTHNGNRRIHVYLTNSLEEYHKESGSIFSQWLGREANGATYIKRDAPVMVLIGNPPYNEASKNNGEWIMELMETYKQEPGSKSRLKERNKKPLNDDYVKFIRMAQHFIERKGEGIIAFINPHGFLDNPTLRGMRWELLRTFDAIYVIDLHGNARKEEATANEGNDENVFGNIRQGVSINFFVKTGNKKKGELGRVYHFERFGRKQEKYQFLDTAKFSDIPFRELSPRPPMYFFVPKDFGQAPEYEKGFAVNELFKLSSIGIVTSKDSFVICDSPEEVKSRIKDLAEMEVEDLRRKYRLEDTRDWSLARAKADVGNNPDWENIKRIDYRWGDTKFLYYTGLTNGIVARPRFRSSSPLLRCQNFALLTVRQLASREWSHVSVSTDIVDNCRISNKTKERGYVFPLYVCPDNAGTSHDGNDNRVPNFHPAVLKKIERALGQEAKPLELFDYVYGWLHSPSYRKRYKEFLKIDFPRIPYPTDKEQYDRISGIGSKLRQLHTMENFQNWEFETPYTCDGNNEVSTLQYKDGRVYINDTQFFGNVPEEAWNMAIGGYQPAQKWLKDRKGKILTCTELLHYKKIIYALKATIALMEKLD